LPVPPTRRPGAGEWSVHSAYSALISMIGETSPRARSVRTDHSDEACPCNTGQKCGSSQRGPGGGFCPVHRGPAPHPWWGQPAVDACV